MRANLKTLGQGISAQVAAVLQSGDRLTQRSRMVCCSHLGDCHECAQLVAQRDGVSTMCNHLYVDQHFKIHIWCLGLGRAQLLTPAMR